MILPQEFRFSQASLQDFQDCHRRFRLRYIDRLAWPALESEPALEHEREMQLGVRFHRLVQQHQTGIPAEKIEAAIRDAELLGWWRNYLDFPIPGLPGERRPEYLLAAPLAGFRLLAKFDLLAFAPGERAVIVDWKTSRKAAPRRRLAERLQTGVYRYVLAEASAHLNGGVPFEPEQVSLVYWFAGEPQKTVVFDYSAAEHAAVGADLAERIAAIAALPEDGFPLTDDERACRFCVYRSLCGRGREAGSLAGQDSPERPDPFDIDLDLEQIAEIAF